ncbi:tetratricopeptide repeat-containing sensor histidine kinase [Aquimarina litoralis]|uniref:tetratricopeptide repeat-containing sensor histidine kinase n=1 Tax=Aquimarina litoralis TaxID=584605 RepID=UPI001C56E7FE|nr:tetratricopeptide repeat-containing sensor histidine kinase [Aquimarina litoralis]MBW1298478.1 tetratricopeptide repeat protein [Aquimarina litoralis]
MNKIVLVLVLWLCIHTVSNAQVYDTESDSLRLEFLYKEANRSNADSIATICHKILQNSNSVERKSFVNMVLGLHYERKGSNDSALHYANRVIELIKHKKDTLNQSRIGSAYRQLGAIYYSRGMYSKALDHFLKGLQIEESVGDEDGVLANKNGIANIYLETKEFDKAAAIYKETIATYKGDNKAVIYGSYINLGGIEYLKNNFEKSAEYYSKALELCEKSKNYDCVGFLSVNLGATYTEFDKKVASYQKGISISKQYGFKETLLQATYNLAVLYSDEAMYKKAILQFDEALSMAKEEENFSYLKDIYEELEMLYIETKNYKKAYENQEKNREIIRIMDSIQSDTEIKDLQLKYETSEKEKEILALHEEQLIKDNQIANQNIIKWSIIIGFGILLIPIGFLLNTYYQRMKTQRKLNDKLIEVNQQKIAGLIKDQELKLVRASIEGQDRERKRIAQQLHDSVGGNLSSIKLQLDSIQKEKTLYNKVIDQIDDTYMLVREISHNLVPKKFSQNPFTNLIKEYLKNVQSSSDLTIIFNPYPEDKLNQIEQEIQVELFNIIQELLTNVLKHAKASNITIQLDHLTNEIKLIFEDNGLGFNQDVETEGIGLSNIKNRLQNFNGKLFIDSKPNRGTIINIDIPIS